MTGTLVLKITFPRTGKLYDYYTTDMSIRKGDFVYVNSPYSRDPVLVKVHAIFETYKSHNATKYIIEKKEDNTMMNNEFEVRKQDVWTQALTVSLVDMEAKEAIKEADVATRAFVKRFDRNGERNATAASKFFG